MRLSSGSACRCRRVSTAETGGAGSVCTSHVERNNLTIRTFLRRFTRLSLGFSKKLSNLVAAVSLHFAYYNYCWFHGTLRKTPAMAAGIAGHPWNLEELFDAIQ